MSTELPLGLGELVQHQADPDKVVGVLLGWLFGPPLRALVRWQGGAVAFEAATDIADLVNAAGAPRSLEIASQIRKRMDFGVLPWTTPLTTTPTTLEQWHPCDGCDELIAPGQSSYAIEYAIPPRVVHLHGACHRLWEAEWRRRGGYPATSRATPPPPVTCPLCNKPIEATQTVIFRYDDRVLHAECPPDPSEGHRNSWSGPRPIQGGSPLPVLTLIGEEHIGRRHGS
jgi:hypothetical protein